MPLTSACSSLFSTAQPRHSASAFSRTGSEPRYFSASVTSRSVASSPPVEDHVLAGFAKLGIDRVVDVELAGVDDRHVEPGRNGVVEEDRMHRAAHRLVATEREAEVRKAAGKVDVRAARFDLAARLDEVQRVAAMLLDAGSDREDIGIEDDVLGWKTLADQQVVGARADLDLALLGVGLAGLVERHDDDRGPIVADLAGMGEEFLLALLHADRIDDWLAGDAFETGLDHAPFRAVDHDRHAGDVGLGGDQLEEGDHRRLGVEQALVHVDVDDLGAVLDLLARYFDRGRVVVRHDQLLEAGRAGDVGPLADIDEGGADGCRFGHRSSGHCLSVRKGVRHAGLDPASTFPAEKVDPGSSPG